MLQFIVMTYEEKHAKASQDRYPSAID